MVNELEIKIKWEDNLFFKMEKKLDGGSWVLVVEIEENTHIAAIAGSLKAICMADISAHLEDIMTEMQSP